MSVHVSDLFTSEFRDPSLFELGARHGHQWAYLFTSPGSEMQLHRVARALTLTHRWFRDEPDFPNYVIIGSRRELAIAHGAIPTVLKEWLDDRRTLLLAELDRLVLEN